MKNEELIIVKRRTGNEELRMKNKDIKRKNKKSSCVAVPYGYFLFFILHFSFFLLFSGCDRRDLAYYTTAEVTVTADWSRANMPYEDNYGSTVVFYPHDGGQPQVVLMGDRTAETARLQVGKYDAILFNRSFGDFGNLSFRGQETLETLEAYATRVETRTTKKTGNTRTVITDSPERMAVDVIRDFEVTEDMIGNYDDAALTRDNAAEHLHFTPCELTRTLQVRVDLKGAINIRSAKCTISGIPASVFLHNGMPGGGFITQEFTLGNPILDAGSPTDGYMEGTLNVFGFDKDIAHKIQITALLVDGVTVEEQTISNLEITEKDTGNGTFQLYIRAEAPETIPEVKPEGGADSSFDADVEDWEKDKEEDIIM